MLKWSLEYDFFLSLKHFKASEMFFFVINFRQILRMVYVFQIAPDIELWYDVDLKVFLFCFGFQIIPFCSVFYTAVTTSGLAKKIFWIYIKQ